MNSDLYKGLVSALDRTTGTRITLVNAMIKRMSELNETYIEENFKVNKEIFLASLRILLLNYEGKK
jgi:hypothetical protein